MRRVLPLAIALIVLVAAPISAQDSNPLAGTWKLVSYQVEVQASQQRLPLMGDKPSGYLTFSPAGRIFFMVTADGRKAGNSDQDRAALLNSMIAYAGVFRIAGDSLATKIDVASNPEWVDTQQVYGFRLEGDRLAVLSSWSAMPNWPDKGTTRSIITFVRAAAPE